MTALEYIHILLGHLHKRSYKANLLSINKIMGLECSTAKSEIIQHLRLLFNQCDSTIASFFHMW
jgi:hypothetical protein